MTPALEELRSIIVDQREALSNAIVDGAHRISSSGPATRPYSKDETIQMVYGFFELLIAAVEGRDKEIREMYLEVVMPGLRDAGTPAGMMIGGSSAMLFMVVAEIAARTSASSRAEAMGWLSRYLGDYLGAIAEIWHRKPDAQ